MQPREPPDFISEDAAGQYLERLLRPHFAFIREVRLELGNEQNLYIDYLARPRDDNDYIAHRDRNNLPFPFDFFGIEIKRGYRDSGIGDYNRALKQAIDYTQATINDPRTHRFNAKRLERVYVWPGLPDHYRGLYFGGVNRLAGLFHVGMIYEDQSQGLCFAASADRQWSVRYGAIRRKHNTRHLVGSGVQRR